MWMTLSQVRADRPIFCRPDCSGTKCVCRVDMNDHFLTRVYVPVNARQTVELHIVNDAHVHLDLKMAHVHADSLRNALVTTSDIFGFGQEPEAILVDESVYYPYFQTAEHYIPTNQTSTMLPLKSGTTSIIPLRNTQSAGHYNTLFKIGNEHRFTFMEILTMPISMFQTHGYYWTECGYYWIFAIVGFASSTLFVLLSRLRIWQGIAIYAAASFSVIFFEKLYHAILAARQVWRADDFAFTVVCVTLLAEGIPFVISLAFSWQAVCRPLTWSALGVTIGSGFFFLAGSGWFLGPGLLILAGLTRLFQRTNRLSI